MDSFVVKINFPDCLENCVFVSYRIFVQCKRIALDQKIIDSELLMVFFPFFLLNLLIRMILNCFRSKYIYKPRACSKKKKKRTYCHRRAEDPS